MIDHFREGSPVGRSPRRFAQMIICPTGGAEVRRPIDAVDTRETVGAGV